VELSLISGGLHGRDRFAEVRTHALTDTFQNLVVIPAVDGATDIE
jgi:hypothetical protein